MDPAELDVVRAILGSLADDAQIGLFRRQNTQYIAHQETQALMGRICPCANAAQRPSIDAEGLLREYATTGNTAIRDRVVEAYLYIASIIARRFPAAAWITTTCIRSPRFPCSNPSSASILDRGVKFASFVTPTMVARSKTTFATVRA